MNISGGSASMGEFQQLLKVRSFTYLVPHLSLFFLTVPRMMDCEIVNTKKYPSDESETIMTLT
jgi:hypothetical protein